jgi:hypothetical protein
MLEQQQAQLVTGLQGLYALLQTGQGWPGQPLREAHSGHPLTHDILERLDVLHEPSDNSGNHEGFEDDCSYKQQKLPENVVPLSFRPGSVSSETEHSRTLSSSPYSGTSTRKRSPFTDLSARNNAPPIPPEDSFFPWQSQLIASMDRDSPIPLVFPIVISRNNATITEDLADFSKPVHGFKNVGNYDEIMAIDPMSIDPNDATMPGWNDASDLDFSTFIQIPKGA